MATVADPLAEVELEPLQAASKAVTGWICIPDTKLSYPLVQGKDNAYYLDRATAATARLAAFFWTSEIMLA